MTYKQWNQLKEVIDGKSLESLPSGFIIDSPWLPGWAGITTLDYFTNDQKWLDANLKAVQTFPELWFFPGFWSEYGMCTEPSAFGAKCIWQENGLPHAEKVIQQIEDIDRLKAPNAASDGLLPFAINRLRNHRKAIEDSGHFISFAVVRGPLNVSTFLMGATEFLIGLRTDTEKIHQLLRIVTDYLISSIRHQKSQFDSIEGILVLDDIIGFCGEPDFKEFAQPYLKEIFKCIDVPVRFLHNDADGNGCAPHLAELGVNVFNYSFLHPVEDMKERTGNKVVLFGNIPPRDVLSLGTEAEIRKSLRESVQNVADRSRIIMSCGGGMPDNVSSEKLRCFTDAVGEIDLNQVSDT